MFLQQGSEPTDFFPGRSMSIQVDQPNRRLSPTRRNLIRSERAVPVVIAPLQDDGTPSKFGIDAISVDISYIGVGVLTTVPMKRSEFALLTLCPGRDREFTVSTRMVHHEKSGDLYRVGFVFIFDDEFDRADALDAIAEFLS
jgi:hypothetical protein